MGEIFRKTKFLEIGEQVKDLCWNGWVIAMVVGGNGSFELYGNDYDRLKIWIHLQKKSITDIRDSLGKCRRTKT